MSFASQARSVLSLWKVSTLSVRFLVLVAIHCFKRFPAATVSHNAKTFVDATFPLATLSAVITDVLHFVMWVREVVQPVYKALAGLRHASSSIPAAA